MHLVRCRCAGGAIPDALPADLDPAHNGQGGPVGTGEMAGQELFPGCVVGAGGGAGGGGGQSDPFAAIYASNNGQGPADSEWAMSAEERARYGAEFERADGDGDGFVTGAEARPILAGFGSALAKPDLRHVTTPPQNNTR